MSFFGGKDIGPAFEAANDVGLIATWFRDFATHPDDYKIRDIDKESMNNAATIIEWVRDNFNDPDFMAIRPFFPDTYVLGPIQYEGNDVTIKTVFDVAGWVLSVVGYGLLQDDPNDPKNLETNKENHFYPLLALFAVMCRTLVVTKGIEPTMVQATWFMKDNVWLVALGANLDVPSNRPERLRVPKQNAQVVRGGRMFQQALIDPGTFHNVNFPNSTQPSSSQGVRGQLFGHCAETLPFLFVKSIMPSLTLVNKSTIGGLAVIPKVLLGSATTYDPIKMHFDPVPKGSKSAMQDPCDPNCQNVIKFSFGKEALSRFEIPIKKELVF